MDGLSRGKLLVKMALTSKNTDTKTTCKPSNTTDKLDLNIPIVDFYHNTSNDFGSISAEFPDTSLWTSSDLPLSCSSLCQNTSNTYPSGTFVTNQNLCPVVTWSGPSEQDRNCHPILSKDVNINKSTGINPLHSPFKTTYGTKPKTASPDLTLYRIQGPSLSQNTPTITNKNLTCYESDDFSDIHEESEFDDSDQDPNWKPEKKRRLLDLHSDDGVEPLPDEIGFDSDAATSEQNESQGLGEESPCTPNAENHTGRRSRKGKPVPLQWDRSLNKTLRMKGKSYRGIKRSANGKYVQSAVKGERKLKERKCSKSCSFIKKCCQFTEEDRLSILNRFWGEMTWEQKKVFVVNMVDQVQIRERKKKAEESRKKVSYKYFLKKKDERLQVCRNMFLSTLDLQDKTVYDWIRNVSDGIPKETVPKKPSVSFAQATKIQKAKDFLKELPKLPSHYCRSTSKKNYLEPVFSTFAELFKVYVDDCKQVDQPSLRRKAFRSIFDDLNLAIHRPKKDKCDICCGFDTGNITEEEYNLHISRKADARNEKALDKLRAETDESLKVITLDLQSLLLCPLLTASSMYYKTKLGCHNYTIFDLTSKESVNYFWHEGVGELNGNTFASCLADYIDGLDPIVKELIIFSDGCTYQNRNTILSNMLLKFATEKQIIITQKYLEKGHTQMECDSVHSTIERRIRGKPIYIPQNYVDLIRTARVNPPYKVKYLTRDFFKNYSSLGYYTSIRPGQRVGDPVVTDIRVINYKDGNIQYKLKFSDDFEDLPRRNKKCSPSVEEPLNVYNLYDTAVKIKLTKFNHLQELKKVIPSDYHPFYDNLEHD